MSKICVLHQLIGEAARQERLASSLVPQSMLGIVLTLAGGVALGSSALRVELRGVRRGNPEEAVDGAANSSSIASAPPLVCNNLRSRLGLDLGGVDMGQS